MDVKDMEGKKDKNLGGRPRFVINYVTLKELCELHCTGEETASVLGCDYDTLNANLARNGEGGYSEYFKRNSAEGRVSLRRRQFKSAVEGNVTMLIWLGKQHLGQQDKISTETLDKTPQKDISTADLREKLKQLGVKMEDLDL